MPKRKKPAAPTTRFIADQVWCNFILDSANILALIHCAGHANRAEILTLLNAGAEAIEARKRGEQRADDETSRLLKMVRQAETCIRRPAILREARASVALDGETQSGDP